MARTYERRVPTASAGGKSQRTLNDTLQRLSSGLRINPVRRTRRPIAREVAQRDRGINQAIDNSAAKATHLDRRRRAFEVASLLSTSRTSSSKPQLRRRSRPMRSRPKRYRSPRPWRASPQHNTTTCGDEAVDGAGLLRAA